MSRRLPTHTVHRHYAPRSHIHSLDERGRLWRRISQYLPVTLTLAKGREAIERRHRAPVHSA